jgi:hypothetical protein
LSQSSPRISLPVGDGAVDVLVKWRDGTERRTVVEADGAGIIELEYAAISKRD